MKYVYFVSYITLKGDQRGRCDISMRNKIKSISDIEKVEEVIKKHNGHPVMVINYQLMREELA